MLLILPLIERMKEIEGWLCESEADLLIITTIEACMTSNPSLAIVEIGSYHGRSTIVLGNVVKHLFPNVKVYAIDPHNGIVGSEGQKLKYLPSSLDKFMQNIEKENLSEVVILIQTYSYLVEWNKPISLLFIDGLHDYFNVHRDFYHFAKWLTQGSCVVFHDYANYYPGVIKFVDELLLSGMYQEKRRIKSLIVLKKII